MKEVTRMPLVQLHEETFKNICDTRFLARLATDCVEERKNPDLLCALIRIMIARQAFGDLFDTRKITNQFSMEFFQKQFARATAAAI